MGLALLWPEDDAEKLDKQSLKDFIRMHGQAYTSAGSGGTGGTRRIKNQFDTGGLRAAAVE